MGRNLDLLLPVALPLASFLSRGLAMAARDIVFTAALAPGRNQVFSKGRISWQAPPSNLRATDTRTTSRAGRPSALRRPLAGRISGEVFTTARCSPSIYLADDEVEERVQPYANQTVRSEMCFFVSTPRLHGHA